MSHNIPKIHRFHLYNGNQLLVQMRYLAQSAMQAHTYTDIHVTQMQLPKSSPQWTGVMECLCKTEIRSNSSGDGAAERYSSGTRCSPREGGGEDGGGRVVCGCTTPSCWAAVVTVWPSGRMLIVAFAQRALGGQRL